MNLQTGVEVYQPDPDLTIYNPYGPAIEWRRSWFSNRALSSQGSAGLGVGWYHNWDVDLIEDRAEPGTVPGLLLRYPSGLTQILRYGADGKLEAGKGANFVVSGCAASADGKWQSITLRFADSKRWRFAPAENGCLRLTRETNRTGQSIDLHWASDGRLNSITGDTEKDTLLQLAYDAAGNLRAAVDAYGRQIAYTVGKGNGVGNDTPCLLSVSQISRAGATAPFRYLYGYIGFSREHKPLLAKIAVPCPTGQGTSLGLLDYDLKGRVAVQTDGNGRKTTYTYASAGGVSRIELSDSKGNRIARDLKAGAPGSNKDRPCCGSARSDGSASQARATDSYGQETKLFYDGHGNLDRAVDSTGRTTRYAYDYSQDPFGRRTEVTRADQARTGVVYDERTGLPTRLTEACDSSYRVTSVGYTVLGEPSRIEVVDQRTAAAQRFVYDYEVDGECRQRCSVGQPLRIEEAGGTVYHCRWNKLGQLVQSVLDDGTRLSMEYNLAGQRTLVWLARPGAQPVEARWVYSYAGGPLVDYTVGDAAETKAAFWRYDQEGRLVAHGTGQREERYVYDLLDRRIAISEPDGQTTRTDYDADGQVSRIAYADGTCESWSYDGLGRVVGATGRDGVARVYRYRGNSRIPSDLLCPSDPGRDTHVAIAADGKTLRMTNGTASVEQQFDGSGQLVAASIQYADRPVQTVSYAYDGLGRCVGMATPLGSATYRYDERQRLRGVSGPIGDAEYQYDRVGRLHSIALPNVQLAEYSYGGDGTLKRVTQASPATGQTRQYDDFALDSGGRLISFTERAADGKSKTVAAAAAGVARTELQRLPDGRQLPSPDPWVFDGRRPLGILGTQTGADVTALYLPPARQNLATATVSCLEAIGLAENHVSSLAASPSKAGSPLAVEALPLALLLQTGSRTVHVPDPWWFESEPPTNVHENAIRAGLIAGVLRGICRSAGRITEQSEELRSRWTYGHCAVNVWQTIGDVISGFCGAFVTALMIHQLAEAILEKLVEGASGPVGWLALFVDVGITAWHTYEAASECLTGSWECCVDVTFNLWPWSKTWHRIADTENLRIAK